MIVGLYCFPYYEFQILAVPLVNSFVLSIGEAFARKMVSQVDFAATISALFDLPVPENW